MEQGTPLRNSPVQRRAGLTVDRILEAANTLILKRGHAYATTKRIAKMAHCSIGTVYHYFPKKESISASLLENLVIISTGPVRRHLLASMHAPLAECLPEQIRLVLVSRRIILEFRRQLHRGAVRTDGELSLLKPEDILYTTNRAFFSHHRSEIKVDDLEAALYTTAYLVIGVTDAHIAADASAVTDEQVVTHLSDVVLRYLTQS